MNLSEGLREPIRNRDMGTKIDMLCSFKRRQLISQVRNTKKISHKLVMFLQYQWGSSGYDRLI